MAALPDNRMIKPADLPTAVMTPAQRIDKQKRLFRKMFRSNEWLEEHDGYYKSKTLKYQQDTPNSEWQGDKLDCCRCIATRKDGQRCKSSVCVGINVCWQHSLKYLKLKSGRTTLRQNNQRLDFGALFACDRSKPSTAVIFHANDIVCAYLGQVITEETLNERYGEDNQAVAPYAARIGQGPNSYIEDSALRRSLGSLINTVLTNQAHVQWGTPGAGIQPNCRIDTIKISGYEMGVIIATRPIKNGQEVLCRSHDANGNLEYIIHTDEEITHKTKGYRPVQRACKL